MNGTHSNGEIRKSVDTSVYDVKTVDVFEPETDLHKPVENNLKTNA